MDPFTCVLHSRLRHYTDKRDLSLDPFWLAVGELRIPGADYCLRNRAITDRQLLVQSITGYPSFLLPYCGYPPGAVREDADW